MKPYRLVVNQISGPGVDRPYIELGSNRRSRGRNTELKLFRLGLNVNASSWFKDKVADGPMKYYSIYHIVSAKHCPHGEHHLFVMEVNRIVDSLNSPWSV